ncbi:hypothetical protein WI98_06650 [Burkholderia vietnamiensis]|nr:hypothetical protein WI98_06650 [Burkholderia vietnamiensis]
MPNEQHDTRFGHAIGQDRTDCIAKVHGNQQAGCIAAAIVEPCIRPEERRRMFTGFHFYFQQRRSCGDQFPYTRCNYLGFQPRLILKLDPELGSWRKSTQLRQDTANQTFEQPRKYGMMAGMFGKFVARLKMHIGNVEPSRIDVGIRDCAARSRFRPLQSCQDALEGVFGIVRGEIPGVAQYLQRSARRFVTLLLGLIADAVRRNRLIATDVTVCKPRE